MPITRLQFSMGIDGNVEALMIAVYRSLEERQDIAYGENELYATFAPMAPGTYIDASRLDVALQKLVETGAVEARAVANTTYYAFRHEVDVATWQLTPDPPSDDADAEADAQPEAEDGAEGGDGDAEAEEGEGDDAAESGEAVATDSAAAVDVTADADAPEPGPAAGDAPA